MLGSANTLVLVFSTLISSASSVDDKDFHWLNFSYVLLIPFLFLFFFPFLFLFLFFFLFIYFELWELNSGSCMCQAYTLPLTIPLPLALYLSLNFGTVLSLACWTILRNNQFWLSCGFQKYLTGLQQQRSLLCSYYTWAMSQLQICSRHLHYGIQAKSEALSRTHHGHGRGKRTME
jgi:hypothetical protein